MAAGGLIAEEAGAIVTNTRNGPDYLTAPQSIIAAAPGIHAQIQASLRPDLTVETPNRDRNAARPRGEYN